MSPFCWNNLNILEIKRHKIVLSSQILQMAEVMTVANRLVRQRPQMTKRLEKVTMCKTNVDLTFCELHRFFHFDSAKRKKSENY